MASRFQAYCEAAAETSWLAAAILIPLFFNISSAEVFEPDKMFMLKILAAIAGAAVLLKRIAAMRPLKSVSGNGTPFRALLRHPLVCFVIALGGAYTLSSLLSIMPSLSWLGLYKRAQGTIAIYCYLILFLATASELRSTSQLRRLQFAFVLTSCPIVGYAILQHFGIDPLPWQSMGRRASATMGNPIFLGAYLIMVIPLTVSRLVDAAKMMRSDSSRRAGFFLVCFFGLTVALQCLALFFAQSRGPVIGLAVAGYIGAFLVLVLKRTEPNGRSVYAFAAAGLGILAPVFLFAVARIVSRAPVISGIVCLGAALICIAFGYWQVWRTSWGRSWLWLTWLMQTVVVLSFFAVAPARIYSENRLLSPLGRLGQLSSNSTDVRRYLWESGLHAVRSVSSPVLPGDRQDSFHYFRPVIGYGPENNGFAANLYGDPELEKWHMGEVVDRLHNETFDNLVTVGFLGTAIWLAIIAAAFYYALQLLGFPGNKRDRFLYILFSVFGILAGILLPWSYGSLQLAGIGVIAGQLAGIVAFVAWSAYRNSQTGFTGSARQVFVLCVLGALIAHFVETGVGIAVAPTRIYFFILLAVFSAFSVKNLDWIEEPAKQRAAKQTKKSPNPLLPFVLLSALVVLILSWCFVINTANEPSALAIFLRLWFTATSGHPSSWPLPGMLILLLLTVGAGLCLLFGEFAGQTEKRFAYRGIAGSAVGIMAAAWLLMGILSANFWTALESPAPIDVALHAEARMTLFLIGLFLWILAATCSLHAMDPGNQTRTTPLRAQSIVLGILISVCALGAIWELAVLPAWADMAYRIGRYYESAGNPPAAIQIYEHATDLAPRVVPYWTAKGMAQASLGISDGIRWQASAQFLQHAVDLNPLDPIGWRNIGNVHMRAGELSTDAAGRASRISKAISYFQQITLLAPNYSDAYSEIGRCYFLLGDLQKADAFFHKSLQTNPENVRTYTFLGEIHYRIKDFERAYQDFVMAEKFSRGSHEAIENVGLLLSLLGRTEEAIQEYLKIIRHEPQDAITLRRIASLYLSKGDHSNGIAFAQRAYDATPAAGRGSFEAFVADLQKK
jgi:tetratricopeptide (TPR) repeat protein